MNRAAQKPILVMAGGTGGHVFPALAVAEYLRRQGEKIVWLGTRGGLEARVVPAADFAIEWLSVQGLRGKGIVALALAPARLLRACWQALGILRRTRPKAVLGMGGFVSGPGGLMAWLLNIPLFVHEQNAIAGLTNRILSRFATRNYFAFPQAAESVPRSECIGNPVRESFIGMGDRPRASARGSSRRCSCWSSAGASAPRRSTGSCRRRSPASSPASVRAYGINAASATPRNANATMPRRASTRASSVSSRTWARPIPGRTW